jgi:phosphopantothenate synthetase
VSLNLKVRKEERARIDKDRLERENARRVAKNQPPLKSIEDLDKSKETYDAVLDQAAQVMADVVVAPRPLPGQKTARTGGPPGEKNP